MIYAEDVCRKKGLRLRDYIVQDFSSHEIWDWWILRIIYESQRECSHTVYDSPNRASSSDSIKSYCTSDSAKSHCISNSIKSHCISDSIKSHCISDSIKSHCISDYSDCFCCSVLACCSISSYWSYCNNLIASWGIVLNKRILLWSGLLLMRYCRHWRIANSRGIAIFDIVCCCCHWLATAVNALLRGLTNSAIPEEGVFDCGHCSLRAAEVMEMS